MFGGFDGIRSTPMVKGDAKPILKILSLEKDVEIVEKLSKAAYEDLLVMYEQDRHVHLRSSLTCLKILSVLMARYVNRNGNEVDKDWLILSKGHAVPALYAVLAELGSIPKSELVKINAIGSLLQNHPEISVPSVDVSTGSLGQGLSIGVGIAAWIKRAGGRGRVYVVIGDGEQDEGIVWEAITHAATLKLDNLIVIVDWNGFQLDGNTEEIKPKSYMPLVWKIVGWRVLWANGVDVVSLITALEEAMDSDKPVVIFAQTGNVIESSGAINNAH
ncbi:MAG: 1-deoxy-D-xylulose-5-phosphate synthase N-terminal domain-containing protein [Ignisphaera sp.]